MSLPRFLGNLVGSSQPDQPSPPTGISRSFELFILNINKAKNKYEENQIVQRELQTIQQNISNPNASQLQMRDYLSRIVYCHMLGYDISWSCIHAVKLAQQGTQLCKKIGYLTCCLLLHRDHDLILLLINTIQKDLKSSNLLDNIAALTTASQLVPAEMIPSLLPMVLNKLSHSSGLVRQKAVMCLHQFYIMAPDLLAHNYSDIHKTLLDKDPAVLASYLHMLEDDIQRSPNRHEKTGILLIKILTQLTMVKMDAVYDYHGIPFPWLRIHLIRCLSLLAASHKCLRKELSEVLEKVLLRINLKENIAFALLYECILCVVAAQPGPRLMDEAAKHVGRFLKSSDPTLKLMGVKALVKLVQADRQYATEYQDLIVESLEHADTSIQRKMYKVLYKISHAGNVKAIVAQMSQQLSSSSDQFWRTEVVAMVIDLASRFPEQADWQVETLYHCVQLGDQEVDDKVIKTLCAVLQKDYMEVGCDIRRQQLLVQRSVSTLMTRDTKPVLVQISAWVIGELCGLLKNISVEKLLGVVIQHLCNTQLSYQVKSCVLSAVHKLLCHGLVGSSSLETGLIESLAVNQPTVIKQRLLLLIGVCKSQAIPQWPDSEKVDTTLSFLDDMVSDDLESGGKPYMPVHIRGMALGTKSIVSSFPETEETHTDLEADEEILSVGDRPRTSSTTSSAHTAEDRETGLLVSGVKQVWSKHGRRDTVEKPTSLPLPKGQTLSEEERRHKELSSALFAGLPFRENREKIISDTEASGRGEFLSQSKDNGGWKKLHETSKAANHSINNPNLTSDNHTDIVLPSNPTDCDILVSFQNQDEPSNALVEPLNAESELEGNEGNVTEELEGTTNDSFSIQSLDRAENELTASMHNNSGYLNISLCSHDDSRVSVSYLADESHASALGEISLLNTSNEILDSPTGKGEREMLTTSTDFNSPGSGMDDSCQGDNGKDNEDSGFEMDGEFSLGKRGCMVSKKNENDNT